MKTLKCKRCKRRYRSGACDAKQWNGVFDRGVLRSVVCPKCQTVAEDLEAKITEVYQGHTLTLGNTAVGWVKFT